MGQEPLCGSLLDKDAGDKGDYFEKLGFWMRAHGNHGTVDICSLPYIGLVGEIYP